jgi:hypothetical protein
VYYELQDEEQRLKYDRAEFVPRVAAADAEIVELQAKLPQPKFTGVQKLIGVEGVPAMAFDPTGLSPGEATLRATTAPAKD